LDAIRISMQKPIGEVPFCDLKQRGYLEEPNWFCVELKELGVPFWESYK
jgi:hypothetical protein